MLDLLEVVRRDIVQILELFGVWVAQRHGQDLLVRDASVHQVEKTDRPYVHEAAGEDRDRHEYEHVQRIVVLGEGAGEEAVVPRVVDRAVEHAVEPEDAQLLVELVLVALVGRGFR